MNEEFRIIISGGGTGGHIFPAVSIANAIRTKYPKAKILFVGAEGRMEMQRVPAAGYEIKGLPIKGFNRANKLKNISVLYKLWKSLRLARKISSASGLKLGAMTPSLTSRLMRSAVALSHSSDRAMKSP